MRTTIKVQVRGGFQAFGQHVHTRLAGVVRETAANIAEQAAKNVEAQETSEIDLPVGRLDLDETIHVVDGETPLEKAVEDGVPWGVWMEMGSKGRSARPWLTPAAEGERAHFERKVEDAVKDG